MKTSARHIMAERMFSFCLRIFFFGIIQALDWRGARVDEWGGLENRCGLWATVGSNPTLSARNRCPGAAIMLTGAFSFK